MKREAAKESVNDMRGNKEKFVFVGGTLAYMFPSLKGLCIRLIAIIENTLHIMFPLKSECMRENRNISILDAVYGRNFEV